MTRYRPTKVFERDITPGFGMKDGNVILVPVPHPGSRKCDHGVYAPLIDDTALYCGICYAAKPL